MDLKFCPLSISFNLILKWIFIEFPSSSSIGIVTSHSLQTFWAEAVLNSRAWIFGMQVKVRQLKAESLADSSPVGLISIDWTLRSYEVPAAILATLTSFSIFHNFPPPTFQDWTLPSWSSTPPAASLCDFQVHLTAQLPAHRLHGSWWWLGPFVHKHAASQGISVISH